MKCLVAISVSREWVESEFLMQMGTWRLPSDCQIKFGWFRQFTAAERHNVAINEAKHNYDRVLFMDTDQVYPPEYIERMLAHEEPVVTALNVSRYNPFEFTTYKLCGEDVKYGVKVPRFEAMQPPAGQTAFECDITGTGALMVNPKVLDKISHPYFKDVYEIEGCVRLIPDDFYFGWQLCQAGIKVTVDQSIVVKHITKILAAPYNVRHLRYAWEAVNSGFGHWKDGMR
jgi:hypothetical protein